MTLILWYNQKQYILNCIYNWHISLWSRSLKITNIWWWGVKIRLISQSNNDYCPFTCYLFKETSLRILLSLLCWIYLGLIDRNTQTASACRCVKSATRNGPRVYWTCIYIFYVLCKSNLHVTLRPFAAFSTVVKIVYQFDRIRL